MSLGDTLEQIISGNDTLNIDSSWSQGRATFGGIVAAIGVRAAANAVLNGAPQTEAGDWALRSVLVNFAGPLSGTVEVETRTLRRGGTAASYMVELKQPGNNETGAVINCVFGRARSGKAVEPYESPEMPSPESLASMPVMAGPLPGFLNNVEVKWLGNGVPASGQKDTSLNAWARLRAPENTNPVEQLVALADMPPPIILSHYGEWVNASSMSWALDIVDGNAIEDGGWVFLDYQLAAAAHGYSQQRGHLYNRDGKLLAVSQQTMAYFEPRA